MDPMIKWIGGTTAAIALLFGGATVAAQLMDGDKPPAIEAAPVLTMEEAIPADDAKTDAVQSLQQPEMVSNPVVQAIPASTPKPTARPKKKDERFVIKRILPIDGPIKYGEWHWDDEGVPPGPLVMTVDLDARVISVFRGGYEIGAAAVLLGTQDHPTPLGTFPIMSKERHNVSEKYDNAPMPYTLRLTRDGIAVHGSQVENGFASHGCVGAPNEFAAKIFAIAKRGDKVIITRGETMSLGESIL
ncbi:L,D-transpeptidase family protein [Altererythrobacter sp. ZODW24]|uniref:L,D-transpeptidase family protein n=1 Tax=Altererythrobacter sp. ZODW24 TaxID=2185142 RepID=UPI000DF791A7|nr:L,D-transpeptidase family protein [Altererythrobacter sp. ZODW24]